MIDKRYSVRIILLFRCVVWDGRNNVLKISDPELLGQLDKFIQSQIENFKFSLAFGQPLQFFLPST